MVRVGPKPHPTCATPSGGVPAGVLARKRVDSTGQPTVVDDVLDDVAFRSGKPNGLRYLGTLGGIQPVSVVHLPCQIADIWIVRQADHLLDCNRFELVKRRPHLARLQSRQPS